MQAPVATPPPRRGRGTASSAPSAQRVPLAVAVMRESQEGCFVLIWSLSIASIELLVSCFPY